MDSKWILVALQQWQFDNEEFAILKVIESLLQVLFVALFNRTMK